MEIKSGHDIILEMPPRVPESNEYIKELHNRFFVPRLTDKKMWLRQEFAKARLELKKAGGVIKIADIDKYKYVRYIYNAYIKDDVIPKFYGHAFVIDDTGTAWVEGSYVEGSNLALLRKEGRIVNIGRGTITLYVDRINRLYTRHMFIEVPVASMYI